MIKVFLAEDEVVMRNGIKKSVPWEEEGFEFAGDASDGELAYPQIIKTRPDILITDIKMPFMDGLELSRLVKKELPNIKIIILSGYNEFDYAKEAISLGVTEYLLKPIGAARLIEVLKKVSAEIEKEREQERMVELYAQDTREDIIRKRYNLWEKLISGTIPMGRLLESGQELGLDFTASLYQVVLFKVSFSDDPGKYSMEIQDLYDTISLRFEARTNVIAFDRSLEGWAFLIKGETPEEIAGEEEELEKTLLEIIAPYQNVSYFGGIGKCVSRLRNVRDSYREAGKAFAARFFEPLNRFIRSEDLTNIQNESLEIDMNLIRSKKAGHDQVDNFLKSGTIDEVHDFAEGYIIAAGEKNIQSLLYRQYIIMDIYFCCLDFLRQLEITVSDLPEKYKNVNNIVAESSDSEKIPDIIEGIFRETLFLRDQNSKKRNNSLLEEAKEFIRSNYQSEEMSLNYVASHVGITPSYFSTIFSAESGQTFVEFLTQVRIDKARELLRCTGMRTSEIAYEVGYKDAHYFSYIFKKVTGVSPKEFRK